MNGLINKFIAVSLAIAMQLPSLNLAMAQNSPDIRSPVIELDIIAKSTADNAQLFTARVIEDNLLKDVLLYHRRAGQQPFTPIAMRQTDNSDRYSISLVTDPTDLRAIEYYIQARDEGGNRTVEGFAFDPYTRILITSNPVINAPAEPTSSNNTANTNSATSTNSEPVAGSTTGKVRWWHIMAGVLVVGALASLASGDSGEGDQGNSTGDTTVPLTINITRP